MEWTSNGPGYNLEGGATRGGRSGWIFGRFLSDNPLTQKELESFTSTNQAVVAVVLLFVAFGFAVYAIGRISSSRKRRRVEEYLAQIESLGIQISLHTRANFLVQPCTRCHENLMILLQVSPNARSVQCKCENCGKGYWAAAANREALVLKDLVSDLEDLKERYSYFRESTKTGPDLVNVKITFTTPESLLPFEQTTRKSIPESTRTEVWRRDSGKCAACNSKHNLQFDHIIPVSKGGSTSAKNLQLLCKTCNLKKHQRI